MGQSIGFGEQDARIGQIVFKASKAPKFLVTDLLPAANLNPKIPHSLDDKPLAHTRIL
jgi:hypothetical protein